MTEGTSLMQGTLQDGESMDVIEFVNDIEVHAHFSDESVKEVFLPLLKKLTKMQQILGRRVIVFLAAPPGCGKTTLAFFCRNYLKKRRV